MIDSQTHSNISLLADQGRTRAKQTGKPVLVSVATPVPLTELPRFFSSQVQQFGGNRFFWSEPGRSLSYVGLGSVLQVESDNISQRYAEVERKWIDILHNCIVEEHIPAYAGPLLFGGFSFDPDHEPSKLWEDFSHTQFRVPQYMLTQTQEEAWLTTNMVISPDQDDIAYEQNLASFEELIQGGGQAAPPGAVHIEEATPLPWMDAVEAAARSIRGGELKKVVLARHVDLKAEHDFQLETILKHLSVEQMNTYVFAIDQGDSCFVGATPERLIQKSGDAFFTLSLAGSIARGGTAQEDEQLGQFLIQDLKNLHEHELAVQMIKGAMEELCDHVDAPEHPILRKLKDIQHLATPISGQAREGRSLMQAVEVLHPTPALGGMPRQAAIEAIRTLENMDRGWYAAPIGWMNRHMDGEFVAAIRSALIQGNEAVLFAGCGIVGDSDPASELHETSLKLKPMLAALQALDAKGKG